MRRHLVIAAVAAALLTGCGGGDSGGGGLTESQLEDVLLGLDDMPDGFSEQQSDDSDDSDEGFCGADTKGDPTASASSDFIKQEGLSVEFISVGIGQYGTEAEADHLMEEFAGVLEDCDETELDGNTYQLEPISAPDLGDETLGMKVTGESDDIEITIELLVIRVQDCTILVQSGGALLTGPSMDTLADVASKQVDRLEDAL